MKQFFTFLRRAAIPMLWLLSVLAIVRGGFQPGLVWQPSPGQTYSFHYQWLGVILMSAATAMECAFLYLVLRPVRWVWSLPRVGVAFALFLILSPVFIRTTTVDVAGSLFAFGAFNLLLTLLLFILLIITAVVTVVKQFSKRMQAE